MAINLKLMLYLYEAMSGLKINFQKTEVLMFQQDDMKTLDYTKKIYCATGS